jgi:hypothetical protein
MDFKDIKVVDFLPELTRPSPKAAGLRHLYLKLSAQPPREWAAFFEEERRFPRHTMWRHAWVQGDCVVVDCVPDELEKYHLNDVKEDVASTNAKYRSYLEQRQRENDAENKRHAEEEQHLNDLKGKLKF